MSQWSCLLDRALYEYTGKFPGLTSHGNCKEDKGFYQRTSAFTTKAIKKEVMNKKPKVLYESLMNQPSQDAPGGCATSSRFKTLSTTWKKPIGLLWRIVISRTKSTTSLLLYRMEIHSSSPLFITTRKCRLLCYTQASPWI